MREQDQRPYQRNGQGRPPGPRSGGQGRPSRQRSGEPHPPAPRSGGSARPPMSRQNRPAPNSNRPARPPANRKDRPIPQRPVDRSGYDSRNGRRDVPSYNAYQRYATGEFDSVVDYDDIMPLPPKKKKVFKRVAWSVVTVLSVVVVTLVIVVNVLISRLTYEEPIPDVYKPNVMTSASADARGIPMASSSGVTNFLMLGSDAGENGRSDTIMLLTIDKKNGKIKMTSFLRDLYVDIPEYRKSKINAAFNHGGADRVIQTIESNFRIKIDAYFRIDFAKLSGLVNKVGGIECTLTQAEANYITKKTSIPTRAGTSRLYGFQSLWYCRIRKLDSDFGRTARQRNFINFMIEDFKSRSLTDQYTFAYEMMPYITTRDDTKGNMFWYLIGALGALNFESEELSIPVKNGYTSKTISGAAVLVPDIKKNCDALREFIYPGS